VEVFSDPMQLRGMSKSFESSNYFMWKHSQDMMFEIWELTAEISINGRQFHKIIYFIFILASRDVKSIPMFSRGYFRHHFSFRIN
jgi:hypothetical protein